jgi:2-oxoglutarate ferredoxin oxidoreductase subunit gamma
VIWADIMLCLSQEGYHHYGSRLREGGLLISDQDLVNVNDVRPDVRVIALPFTSEAEKMNRRIVANVMALGALAVLTGVVKPGSLARALPSRLPERNVHLALDALGAGVQMAEARRESIA